MNETGKPLVVLVCRVVGSVDGLYKPGLYLQNSLSVKPMRNSSSVELEVNLVVQIEDRDSGGVSLFNIWSSSRSDCVEELSELIEYI